MHVENYIIRSRVKIVDIVSCIQLQQLERCSFAQVGGANTMIRRAFPYCEYGGDMILSTVSRDGSKKGCGFHLQTT